MGCNNKRALSAKWQHSVAERNLWWGVVYSLFRVSWRSQMRRDCLTHTGRNYVEDRGWMTEKGRRLRFGARSNFLSDGGATVFSRRSCGTAHKSHTHTHLYFDCPYAYPYQLCPSTSVATDTSGLRDTEETDRSDPKENLRLIWTE